MPEDLPDDPRAREGARAGIDGDVAWLRALRSLVDQSDIDMSVRQASISAWSVGQHLEHALRALRGCLASATHIRTGRGRAGLETRRSTVELLADGRLQRGAASAPARTVPAEVCTGDTIRELLVAAEEQVKHLSGWDPENDPAEGHVAHHDLGPMAATEWLQFAAVHTRHHLSIVREILAHLPK